MKKTLFIALSILIKSAILGQDSGSQLNISIRVLKASDDFIKVEIVNSSNCSIFITNDEKLGQGSYHFITNCDSLNSKVSSINANLPFNYMKKLKMVRVRPGKHKKLKFKIVTKWYEMKPCLKNNEMQFYFDVVCYGFEGDKLITLEKIKTLKTSSIKFK